MANQESGGQTLSDVKERVKVEGVRRFLGEEDGATMAEYGIMVVLIAAVCFAAVKTIGVLAASLFQSVPPF